MWPSAWVLNSRGALAEPDPPRSARQFYNDGTQKLREGKWREAEASLQMAVASNHERIQPPALYNLGQVRFRQGVEALKDAPDTGVAQARSQAAYAVGDQAVQAADAALASDEIKAIVRAYMQGRGARKDLKGALEAVRRAMDAYSAVLSRWQRASGDFKSADELASADADARFNAGVVDRHIAALVDRQRLMQMALPMLSGKQDELRERMQELKKRLPDGEKKALGEDEDEDEEDQPGGPKEGQQEAKPKDGHEMAITPEEAARLLESLQLDAHRKLPMGTEQTGETRARKGRDW